MKDERLKAQIRAVAGLLAVATLLALFIAEFAFVDGSLPPDRIRVLLYLIAALLGVDIAADRLPFTVRSSENGIALELDTGGETNTPERERGKS